MLKQLTLGVVLSAFISSAYGQNDADFGRVRYTFTAGTILSKAKDNFQKADLHMAFNVDKTWIRRSKVNVNTYFDARLTAIPVAPGSGDQADGSTELTTPPAATTATFAESQKAALLQAGMFVPIAISEWTSNTRKYQMFIAPIAKAGIQTITGNSISAEARNLGSDDLFNFGAMGARLGHVEIERDGGSDDFNKAPRIISYIDLTFGRWENFEHCEQPFINAGSAQIKQLACPDTSLDGTTMRRVRPYRFGFEGRLKIPSLPLFVGFDANAGRGPDDLRFLFGTRFDVGDLLKELYD
jgi:hypothetical protein